MDLRENGYAVELAAGMIPGYEERVLTSGLCDFSLPMTFTHRKGRSWAHYDCRGYVAAGEMDLKTPADVLEIMEKTLITLRKSGEFLIDPSRVLLTKETVYYHPKKKQVRIAYMPNPRRDPGQIFAFLRDLAEGLSDEWRETIEDACREAARRNYSLQDLADHIGRLRRGKDRF